MSDERGREALWPKVFRNTAYGNRQGLIKREFWTVTLIIVAVFFYTGTG